MPVVVIPCTKYFCREKNRIKAGTIERVAIASAPPQLDTAPASPTNVRKALDTVKISGFVRYSRWLKKSSHVHRKVNRAVVTRAGAESGKMMRTNTPKGVDLGWNDYEVWTLNDMLFFYLRGLIVEWDSETLPAAGK